MRYSFTRIYSQVYKNMKLLFGNYFRLFDVTVWPLVLFFTIVLFVQYFNGTQQMISLVILGVIGWRTIYNMQMDMVTGYMDELWPKALPHLVASPIRKIEFIIGGMLSGAVKTLITLAIIMAIAIFVYHLQISDPVTIGLGLIAFVLLGASLGMISLGVIYIYGEDVVAFTFAASDVLVTISGIYYPVTIFPEPVRSFAYLLPSTYAFDMFKSTIGLVQASWLHAIGLSLAFFAAAYLFNEWAYNYARKKGKLVKMG